jgi:UDPglucose 6-dehydrogenase
MTHHLVRKKCPRPVLVIVTEWKAFKSPDLRIINARLKNPVIFDGRNLFEPADIKALGFEYHGIGR